MNSVNPNPVTAKLIKHYPLVSEQMDEKRLAVILESLADVLNREVEGAITEFGCYSGTTSLFIRRLLDQLSADYAFHVYDSFLGLPHKSIEDASVAGTGFKAGELKASKRMLLKQFHKAGLRPPLVHRGWFNTLKPRDLPETIAFAFLDSDFYRSILDSLELVWPRLSAGGMVVIDDYQSEKLPGVYRAVDEYFSSSPVNIRHKANLAIIKKDWLRLL